MGYVQKKGLALLWAKRVVLKYAGTMAPMAPISLVVGWAKAEL